MCSPRLRGCSSGKGDFLLEQQSFRAIWRRFDALRVKAVMAVLTVSYVAKPFLSYFWYR